jgi:hypothetical protein
MGIAYEQAKPDHEVFDLIHEILEQHHPDLAEAQVKIGVLFAYAPLTRDGSPQGPSVKLHGVACAAVVKVNSTKGRAEGLSDATITIDGHLWGGVETAQLEPMADDRRKSLLDHEVTHLELLYDGNGAVKLDDLGRPRLKTKPHDFEVGWFRSIAERYGAASFEVQQAATLVDGNGQLLFPWAVQAESSRKAKSPVSLRTAAARA